MSIRPLTKAQKREIRRLTGLAHARELAMAAGELQAQFERWSKGEFDVFELNERIHQYHDGISRDLYKRYVMGEAEWSLAAAIAREIVREPEVDPAILEYLRDLIVLVRQAKAED
jgi:hypothetical protein